MRGVILVTGATGFIGVNYFQKSAFKVDLKSCSIRLENVEEINFESVRTIVHLSGKAHEMKEIDTEIYFKANRDLTFELALNAKLSGVSQFIYLSSVKVYGKDETTSILNERSPCQPIDPYGQSKLEAENKILLLNDESFSVSIIRPPLVYGAYVKGNIIKLLKLSDSSIPLPFLNLNNVRSMVYVGNLCALIDRLIEFPKSGVFIAGDNKSISTSYLVELIRKKMRRRKLFFILPKIFIRIIGVIKPNLVKRLFYSLEFDNSCTNEILKFTPPFSVEYGVDDMVKWYHSREKKSK